MSIENKITGGILEGWQFVTKIEVDVNTTEVTISGLNGDEDVAYLLLFFSKNAAADNSLYYLRPNGLTTNLSYQRIAGNGTSITAERGTTGEINQNYVGSTGFSVLTMFAKSGRQRRWVVHNSIQTSGGVAEMLHVGVWGDTSTVITSLKIVASLANGIGADSEIIILKASKHTTKGIKEGWEKIADIEVTSDSTSISISGLTGDSDQIYRLGSLIKNPTGAGARYELRPNGDSIGTSQKIYAEGTTRSAERNAFFQIQENRAGEESLSHTVMFAKSGVQRRFVSHLSSGALFMMLWSNLWDNSTSVITSLEIVSSQTGGIGAGSRFILYRLRS